MTDDVQERDDQGPPHRPSLRELAAHQPLSGHAERRVVEMLQEVLVLAAGNNSSSRDGKLWPPYCYYQRHHIRHRSKEQPLITFSF
jgi:hypothetical protein